MHYMYSCMPILHFEINSRSSSSRCYTSSNVLETGNSLDKGLAQLLPSLHPSTFTHPYSVQNRNDTSFCVNFDFAYSVQSSHVRRCCALVSIRINGSLCFQLSCSYVVRCGTPERFLAPRGLRDYVNSGYILRPT